jgi:hypothetical protein
MTGLPCFGFVATPSLASYRRTIAVRERKYLLPAFGNGSTNEAMFSQTSDKAKTRQSSHELHVVNSYPWPCFSMMGNPLMNHAQLSQTAGQAKTRQPGHLMKPTQNALRSYEFSSTCSRNAFLQGRVIVRAPSQFMYQPSTRQEILPSTPTSYSSQRFPRT